MPLFPVTQQVGVAVGFLRALINTVQDPSVDRLVSLITRSFALEQPVSVSRTLEHFVRAAKPWPQYLLNRRQALNLVRLGSTRGLCAGQPPSVKAPAFRMCRIVTSLVLINLYSH